MTLLRVDASIQGPNSASSALADLVLAEFAAARPNEPVVTRHLGQQPVPAGAWGLAVGGPSLPRPTAPLTRSRR
jgi:FMN-dependent NADH-azoreductase